MSSFFKFVFNQNLETVSAVNPFNNARCRSQILIKNKLEERGHQFVSSFLNKITMPGDIKLSIDVDPLDIL